MANRADWQMLNDSLGNLGNSFVVQRQMEQQEKDRAADRAMRERLMDEQVEQRREAATARNTPRVSAFIGDPDHPEQGVTVEGDWEGIQNIAAHAEQKNGKPPVILPKPPTDKGIHRSYKVGNMTIHTYGEAESQKIEEGLRAKGIDPTAAAPAPGLTPVKTPGFTGALTPGGHYVKPDAEALSEPDKIKLASLYRQMSSIDKETREMADNPNPGRARALNAQRQQLQTQIDGYTKKPAGTQPEPDFSTTAPNAEAGDAGADELVPVLNPKGQPVRIKKSQLQQALGAGYKAR